MAAFACVASTEPCKRAQIVIQFHLVVSCFLDRSLAGAEASKVGKIACLLLGQGVLQGGDTRIPELDLQNMIISPSMTPTCIFRLSQRRNTN